MAFITSASTFDPVYQIEATDSVQGGAGQIANSQAQSLANRTQYLKDAITTLPINALQILGGGGGTYNLSATGDTGKLIELTAAGTYTVNLPDLGSSANGTVFHFWLGINAGTASNYINIVCSGTDKISYPNNVNPISSYLLYDGGITLKKVGYPNNQWSVINRWMSYAPSMIAIFPTGSVPSGWLPCSGGFVASTLYPELFSKIGYTFGNPGGGNFALPTISSPVTNTAYYIHV